MSQTHISLPPANEVWGKVIFLHLSVILFTGGGVPGKVPTRAGTPPAIVARGYCFHRRLSIHGGGVGMSLAMTTRCH